MNLLTALNSVPGQPLPHADPLAQSEGHHLLKLDDARAVRGQEPFGFELLWLREDFRVSEKPPQVGGDE